MAESHKDLMFQAFGRHRFVSPFFSHAICYLVSSLQHAQYPLFCFFPMLINVIWFENISCSAVWSRDTVLVWSRAQTISVWKFYQILKSGCITRSETSEINLIFNLKRAHNAKSEKYSASHTSGSFTKIIKLQLHTTSSGLCHLIWWGVTCKQNGD